MSSFIYGDRQVVNAAFTLAGGTKAGEIVKTAGAVACILAVTYVSGTSPLITVIQLCPKNLAQTTAFSATSISPVSDMAQAVATAVTAYYTLYIGAATFNGIYIAPAYDLYLTGTGTTPVVKIETIPVFINYGSNTVGMNPSSAFPV